MPDGSRSLSNGTAPIRGDARQRVRQFFWEVGDASRYYALFRTEALQHSFPADIGVFGFDWIVLALTLVEGDHLETDEVLLTRSAQARGHYFRTLLRNEPAILFRLVPYLRMYLCLRKHLPRDIWRGCRLYVVRYNVLLCGALMRYQLPWLDRPLSSVAALEKRIHAFATRLGKLPQH